MSRSKKLLRQFKKALDDESSEEKLQRLVRYFDEDKARLATLGVEGLEALETLKKLPQFFDAIEASYTQADKLLDLANRSLELSSRELSNANINLIRANQAVSAMVNSLGQGFLMFGRDGICLGNHSKATEDLLEGDPTGKHISDVLHIDEKNKNDFHQWIGLLFNETIDFADLAELGPKTFENSHSKYVTLEFKPARDAASKVEAIVVVATDRTSERQAKWEAQERQSYAEMIIKLARERNQFFQYVRYVREGIVSLRSGLTDQESLVNMRRLLHTIKGGASSFFIMSLRSIVHDIESEFTELSVEQLTSSQVSTRMKQAAEQIERAINTVLREHTALLGHDFEKAGFTREVSIEALYSFARELLQKEGGESLANRFIETVVSVPFKNIISNYESSIQALAIRANKKLKPLEIVGGETKVLAEVYQDVFSNLVHLFTNAIDHGIESPQERARMGKDAEGQISVRVSAERVEGAMHIRILVTDDGAGINLKKLKEKILGNRTAPAGVDVDDWLKQQIFDNGVSTAGSISETSGRGIGLDALKMAVERLNGTIRVDSEPLKGTRFTILLPWIWSIPDQVTERLHGQSETVLRRAS